MHTWYTAVTHTALLRAVGFGRACEMRHTHPRPAPPPSLPCVFVEKAPLARAADDSAAEPFPVRLQDEGEAGGGPRRPHVETPDGGAAAGGGAPDSAIVRLPSRA